MQEPLATAAHANKHVLTFTPTGTETLKSLIDAWAEANNSHAISTKIIRAIGMQYTVEVTTGAGPAPAKPAEAASVGIDLSRDALLTDFGRATLLDRYLVTEAGETSPQHAFMRVATAFGDDAAHTQRLYNYASKMWFMFATPVLSNGGTKRGMPISCFLNFTPDSRSGLTDHYTENAWLSSLGGGIGAYWGAVRSNGINTKGGSRSSGVIPFLKVVDAEVLAFAQGVTRRASYAAYMDVSHPEIMEFLEMRKPTGGDVNRKCLNLHNAVNIPDAFMEIIEACVKDPDADDSWPLVDPHTQNVIEMVSAKEIWQKLLELRIQTGEPYLHFIDTTNRALPRAQREAGLRVHQSNLCTEITLPTNEERTAVCCLSSVNFEKFDEWKGDEMFIEDLIRMLDNVLEYFIQNAPDALKKAKYSAMMERSVGLGAMGFHSYLQKKAIPFESALATSINRRLFAHIKSRAEAATVKLAQERGPCPDAKGEMRRNMHLLAIAPNASTSIICGGTSPGIEPIVANAFTHKTQSGSFLVKNKFLEDLLETLGQNTDEVWQSIIVNKGSVQQLEFLDDNSKDLFKTAMEINNLWIIEHAAQRQEYICQAQSVNLFLPADVQISFLHQVHFRAWKAGLKSLYYVRSSAIRRADVVSTKVGRNELKDTDNVCLSCEG
jgi:ribonucleoside-diphosphate reductase alpha chain